MSKKYDVDIDQSTSSFVQTIMLANYDMHFSQFVSICCEVLLKNNLALKQCTVSKTKKNQRKYSKVIQLIFQTLKRQNSHTAVLYTIGCSTAISIFTQTYFSRVQHFCTEQYNNVGSHSAHFFWAGCKKILYKRLSHFYQKQVFPPQSIMKLALHKLGILN